jgi:hypothetical protein
MLKGAKSHNGCKDNNNLYLPHTIKLFHSGQYISQIKSYPAQCYTS